MIPLALVAEKMPGVAAQHIYLRPVISPAHCKWTCRSRHYRRAKLAALEQAYYSGHMRMGPEAAEPMKRSPLSQLFPDVNWAVLFTKLGELLSREYDWSPGVATITAPTQLVFADADAVRPEHIVEFFTLLGGGQRDAGLDGTARARNQLAILPGLTHYSIITALGIAATVVPFLEAPLP